MKDLNDIIAANANTNPNPRPLIVTVEVADLETIKDALLIAKASLLDALKYGAAAQQRRNIDQTDLPAIRRALSLLQGFVPQSPAAPVTQVRKLREGEGN